MKWTLDDSRRVYGVAKEDLHFLDIDAQGNLCITLRNQSISFGKLIQQIGNQAKNHGYSEVPSFILHVPELIDSQIKKMEDIFQRILAEYRYKGKYRFAYPLKVNPHKSVINKILSEKPEFGFEVGTKSELVFLLKELQKAKHRLIICNGVKNSQYTKIICQALEDGFNLLISLDSQKDAETILEQAPRQQLRLALRIKPYVSIISHWSTSVGRNSKFGLGIHELLQVIELIKRHNAENLVVALHAHPGSQVSNNTYSFVEFIAQVYARLHDFGFKNLNILDLGGGLPINYDGYLAPGTLQANVMATIVALAKILEKNYPHPEIIIESGRVLTALHTLLVIQVLNVRSIFPTPDSTIDKYREQYLKLGLELKESKDARTIFHKWKHWLGRNPTLDQLIDLNRYEQLTGLLKKHLRQEFVLLDNYEKHMRDPIAKELLSPEYVIQGSFSVFNGAIDHILVDQYFPILPISNLHKQPDTLARLVDLTGDSDGEISNYRPPLNETHLFTKDGFPLTTTHRQLMTGFPIGDLNALINSYLVIALVGAYQENIKMQSSLINDLPRAILTLTPKGQWQTTWINTT